MVIGNGSYAVMTDVTIHCVLQVAITNVTHCHHFTQPIMMPGKSPLEGGRNQNEYGTHSGTMRILLD